MSAHAIGGDVERTSSTEVAPSALTVSIGLVTDPEQLADSYEAYFADISDFITRCVHAEGFGGFADAPTGRPDPLEFTTVESLDASLESEWYGVTANIRRDLDFLTRREDNVSPADEFIEGLSHDELGVFASVYNECTFSAEAEYPRPNALRPAEEELMAAFEERWSRSPSREDVWRSWSDCMANVGYRVRDREHALLLVEEAASEVYERAGEHITFNLSRGTNDAAPSDLLDDLGEVEAVEAQTAKDDLACSRSLNLADRLRDARAVEEQMFVEDNAAALFALDRGAP